LKAKYYPNSNLLDTVAMGETSQTWKAIEYGLAPLNKGMIWRVGNGSSIRIWRDNWIPRPFGMKPIGCVRPCRLRRVSHFIDQQSKSWDETQIRRYFHPCDVEEILKINLSPRVSKDWFHGILKKVGSSRSEVRIG
jgi:hypothetical protein